MESLLSILAQKNEIWGVVLLSIGVSGSATLISAAVGIPLGAWIAISEFRGKRIVTRLTYTLMALPPVLAGLVVYLTFSRSGPLGSWGWLFTPTVMVVAQCLLVTPIIVGLSSAAIASRETLVMNHALSLGATRLQGIRTLISESRPGIISAVMTGFGRAFAEVGAVMLVGGNIRFKTRVLTTSIMLETRQGNYDMAITLGLILLCISFVISTVVLRNTTVSSQQI